MITIHKVSFEFEMENEAFARTLYGNWDSFCRFSFEHVVDDTLSRFDTSDDIIQLESLELDLGCMPEEDFYDLFPKQLAIQLKDTFSAFLLDPQAYSRQIQIIPATRNKLEVLAFYLQYGYFHWETGLEIIDFQTLILSLLQTDEEGLRILIRSVGDNEAIRDRLVTQLPDKVLELIITLLEPIESNFINNYTRVLSSLYPHTEHSEIGQRDFRDVIQNLIFAYLLYPNRGYFNRKQFVWQTIYGLSKRYNIRLLTLIDLLTSQVKVLSEGQSLLPELFMILTDIRKEVRLDEKQEEYMYEAAFPISDKRLSPPHAKETVVASPSKYLFLTNTIQMLAEQKKKDDFSDACLIPNAGLALVASFLPRLFKMLGYLAEDLQTFKSKDMQQRAIFVIQNFLSDGISFPESQLVFNKLLTGYPLPESLPLTLALTDEEKKGVDRVRDAILQNWDKMRNTSKEGFRDAFLIRNGKLTRVKNRWHLQVEQKSYDILLTTLPWSYKLIKTTYIPDLIKIEWI